MKRGIRLVILGVVGVEGGGLELVLSFLHAQTAVFPADDVELADHLIVLGQVIGVDV